MYESDRPAPLAITPLPRVCGTCTGADRAITRERTARPAAVYKPPARSAVRALLQTYNEKPHALCVCPAVGQSLLTREERSKAHHKSTRQGAAALCTTYNMYAK